MKNLSLIISFLLICNLVSAQNKQTVSKAAVTYKIKNLGINTSGSFGGFEGNIIFNPASLNTSVIEASVDSRTLNSDNEMRDNHLKKEEYFDVEHYPKISIKSISFKQKNKTNYIGTFDLTIKGKTKRLEVPFTYIVSGNSAVYNGDFKINRLDFDIGGHSMMLANEAIITVNIDTTL